MKRLRLLLPLGILLVALAVFVYMQANPPKPDFRSPPPTPAIEVDVVSVSVGDFQPYVRAQGEVRASQQTQLSSEVSGRIEEIARVFAVGEQVAKGQLLIRLESHRYLASVAIARADLTSAEALLVEEQARAALAKANWERSNQGGSPNDLTLRKPQLAAAQARVGTARNRLATARLDLAATQILAPYAGLIIEASANLGQLVSAGTRMGTIMAANKVEVRAPLSSDQLVLVPPPPLDVQVLARFGQTTITYPATLVRREARLDQQTRQLGMIAEVINPYSFQVPLLPGQFVILAIPARQLADVADIPLSALDTNHRVSLVADGLLMRRQVEVANIAQTRAQVRGLQEGELLITTQVNNLADGTRLVARSIGPGGEAADSATGHSTAPDNVDASQLPTPANPRSTVTMPADTPTDK